MTDPHTVGSCFRTTNLGLVYTMANGHDLEIPGPLETHAKAISWKIESEFCVVMGL